MKGWLAGAGIAGMIWVLSGRGAAPAPVAVVAEDDVEDATAAGLIIGGVAQVTVPGLVLEGVTGLVWRLDPGQDTIAHLQVQNNARAAAHVRLRFRYAGPSDGTTPVETAFTLAGGQQHTWPFALRAPSEGTYQAYLGMWLNGTEVNAFAEPEGGNWQLEVGNPSRDVRWPPTARCAALTVPPFASGASLCLLRLGFTEEARQVLRVNTNHDAATPEFIARVNAILGARTIEDLQALHGPGRRLNVITA